MSHSPNPWKTGPHSDHRRDRSLPRPGWCLTHSQESGIMSPRTAGRNRHCCGTPAGDAGASPTENPEERQVFVTASIGGCCVCFTH